MTDDTPEQLRAADEYDATRERVTYIINGRRTTLRTVREINEERSRRADRDDGPLFETRETKEKA